MIERYKTYFPYVYNNVFKKILTRNFWSYYGFKLLEDVRDLTIHSEYKYSFSVDDIQFQFVLRKHFVFDDMELVIEFTLPCVRNDGARVQWLGTIIL